MSSRVRKLRAMQDFKVIWYDGSVTEKGTWRVSVKGGHVFMHLLTDNGWEGRATGEHTVDLLRAACAHKPPSRRTCRVEGGGLAEGWACDFAWVVDAGQPYQEVWWQQNSVDEPVRRRAEDVPPAVKCAILAEFSAQ